MNIADELNNFHIWYLQPLIVAMELELSADGLEAPWVKTAQRIVGGAFEDEVLISLYENMIWLNFTLSEK